MGVSTYSLFQLSLAWDFCKKCLELTEWHALFMYLCISLCYDQIAFPIFRVLYYIDAKFCQWNWRIVSHLITHVISLTETEMLLLQMHGNSFERKLAILKGKPHILEVSDLHKIVTLLNKYLFLKKNSSTFGVSFCCDY